MEHEVFVPVPAERLREVLDDPARVARAVPGLQQDAGAEPVAGRLKIRVGSHSVTYRGAVRVSRGDDGVYAVEGDATEARGTGSVKLALRIALRDAEGGTTILFDGTAAADGRIRDLPSDAVESAVSRLLNRFAEHLAAAAPATTTPLATQDFEPRATTDYETTPDADDAPPPPPAEAEGGAGTSGPAAGTAAGTSAGGAADEGRTAGAGEEASATAGAAEEASATAGEASAPGPDNKTPPSGPAADDARASEGGDDAPASEGGDEPPAPGLAGQPPAPASGDDAPASRGGARAVGDDARASGGGDEPPAPGPADQPPAPASGDDAPASGHDAPAVGDDARASEGGGEPPAPGPADQPPAPASGDDAPADEPPAPAPEPPAPGPADQPPAVGDDAPADEPPAPAPEPPAAFGADIPSSSHGASRDDDEDDEDIAEAAHARRTMIGRSAEEVDHAPPRGRYAPVPAPQTVMPSAPLRWAAPAAAVALASAIVAVRALRRRR